MAPESPGPVDQSRDSLTEPGGQEAADRIAGAVQDTSTPTDEVSVDRPAGPRTPGRLRGLAHATLPGSWGALVVGCLSFTPSLLPRGGLIQGLVWGITAAIGYGLGVVAAWVWRAFADRDPRPPRSRAWPTFLVSAAVLVSVAFGLGQYWQYQIRGLMGVTDYNIALVVVSPLVAAVAFGLLILIGRGLRHLYRSAARLLRRWIGSRAATAVGWVLVRRCRQEDEAHRRERRESVAKPCRGCGRLQPQVGERGPRQGGDQREHRQQHEDGHDGRPGQAQRRQQVEDNQHRHRRQEASLRAPHIPMTAGTLLVARHPTRMAPPALDEECHPEEEPPPS